MTLVFFLEELSAKETVKGVVPRILPADIDVRCVVFDGKQDLEKQIEKKIKNWLQPDTKFVILRDKDSGDCLAIKRGLYEKCKNAGRDDTLIRIACHELESWYLGDLEAVEAGLNMHGIAQLQNNHKFRVPDNLANAPQELYSLTKKKYQKVSGSRDISRYLKIDGSNKSYSFNVFIDGIRKIITTKNKD